MVISTCYDLGCSGGPYEKELLTDLLKNYNTQNRPVINESSPIVITFGVTLQQIVDLVSIKVVTGHNLQPPFQSVPSG